LNWYAFLVGTGASLAVWRVVQTQKKKDDFQWVLASLWILLGAWIGARLAFLIWQPAILVDFGWQALRLREGGMVWPGAVLGAWVTVLILSFIKRVNWLEVADRLLVMLPPLVIMSWLAAWISGSSYGPEMGAAWWVPMTMDDSFQYLPRFPLQWVAATSLFIIYFLIESRLRLKKTGAQSAVIWFLFCTHTFVFSLLRADQRPEWLGLYWDIWFLILCLLWLMFLIWSVFFKKTRQQLD